MYGRCCGLFLLLLVVVLIVVLIAGGVGCVCGCCGWEFPYFFHGVGYFGSNQIEYFDQLIRFTITVVVVLIVIIGMICEKVITIMFPYSVEYGFDGRGIDKIVIRRMMIRFGLFVQWCIIFMIMIVTVVMFVILIVLIVVVHITPL